MKLYTLGKKIIVERAYFGYPEPMKWNGNEVNIVDFPNDKFHVFVTGKGGWKFSHNNKDITDKYNMPNNRRQAILEGIAKLKKGGK